MMAKNFYFIFVISISNSSKSGLSSANGPVPYVSLLGLSRGTSAILFSGYWSGSGIPNGLLTYTGFGFTTLLGGAGLRVPLFKLF